MTRHTRLAWLLTSSLTVLTVAPSPAIAQPDGATRTFAEAPSAAETEFWRSAERIGTEEAYRSYLSVFPTGFFAPLARAALAKLGDNARTPAAAPPPDRDASKAPQGLTTGGNLKPFSAPARNSGATTLQLGDRFTGPGVVTVGWLGAKKQVVLPSGEWIALSVVDRDSRHAQPVKLTTVIFGKFARDKLVTAFFASTSRVSSTVTSWADIEECDKADPLRVREWKSSSFALQRECSFIKVSANPLPSRGGAIGNEFHESLKSLGGSTISGPALLTAFNFTDRSNGFMRVARMDWPSSVLGEDAASVEAWKLEAVERSKSRKAYLSALASWANKYRKFAGEGFRRDIIQEDLVAGAQAPTFSAVQGVTDFDAGARLADMAK